MSKARMMAIGSLCVAMAFILNQFPIFRMPQGGSVTAGSMLFIVLAGYLLGPAYGILSGITMGLLDTIMGAFFVHPVQYLLDYPVAFGALGLAGFFRKWKYGLLIGYIVGALGRFVSVYMAGVVFWGVYAPEGQSPWLYSFVYNITYIGVEMLITLLILVIPPVWGAIERVSRTVNAHPPQ